MDSSPVRLGIIGAGGIGQMHAASARDAGSDVVAVTDIDEAAARSLADAHAADVCADLRALCAHDAVEAVVVAVPNALHVECAETAVALGRDVLLEKPMATNVPGCESLIDAVRATDRFVQVGFVSRYAPAVEAVREKIVAGEFGRIYRARASYIRRRGIPGLGGWFTTRAAAGGGVLIDLGVHAIDLMLHLAGRPAPRRASGVCGSHFGSPIASYRFDEMWGGPPRLGGTFDVEDDASALIRCDDGFTMALDAAWAANVVEEEQDNGVLLLGEKGGAMINPWEGKVRLVFERDGAVVDEAPTFDPETQWDLAWQRQHEDFARNVRKRTAPGPSVADGLEVQRVLDAIYRSSDEGREVEL